MSTREKSFAWLLAILAVTSLFVFLFSSSEDTTAFVSPLGKRITQGLAANREPYLGVDEKNFWEGCITGAGVAFIIITNNNAPEKILTFIKKISPGCLETAQKRAVRKI